MFYDLVFAAVLMSKEGKPSTYFEKDNVMFTEDGIKIYKIYIPHAGRVSFLTAM